MEQSVILDSLTKHLDALAAVFNYSILLAVLTIWTGLRRKDELEVLGLKLTRHQALFIVSPLYLLLNLTVLILFLRIGDLLNLLAPLQPNKFPEGFSRLAAHTWLLNPFAYFGTTRAATWYEGDGYGLLIVTWWLCNSSLLALAENVRNHLRVYFVFSGLFLLIGLGSMVSINRVFEIVHTNRQLLSPNLQQDLLTVSSRGSVETDVGIVVGGLLHFVVLALQSRLWLSRERSKAHGART